MQTTNETASRRYQWADVPSGARKAVERCLGTTILTAQSKNTGFTHGLASILHLEDGKQVFVKGMPDTDYLAPTLRVEASHAPALSSLSFVPSHIGTVEHESWLILISEAIFGRHPDPADREDLKQMCTASLHMSSALTPSPAIVPPIGEVLGPSLDRWRATAEAGPPIELVGWPRRNLARLAELEADWPSGALGQTLTHRDLRSDNLLLCSDGAFYVVDWAGPCIGASWIDYVLLAVSAMAHGGSAATEYVEQTGTLDEFDPRHVNAFLAAVAGHWTLSSFQPTPTRSPHLREHQRSQSQAALAWLARRIGR